MKRRLLATLFLAASALNAAAQRVALEVPLSPRPSLTAAASIAPPTQAFPLSLSHVGPSLPAATAAAQPLLHEQAPQVIDSLRAHGLDAAKFAGFKGESGSAALEANFMSAASLADGVVTRSADDATPHAGPAKSSRSLLKPAELLRTLRASLDIAPDADPRAAAVLNEALESLINTPTGRELALEFTASGARAKVEFGDVKNSATAIMNGRRILQASGGHTHTDENPPRVVLNRHYLDTDPDYRRVNMAGTLGHELFGHAFEMHRSKKAGILENVIYYYRGDEAGAGLIGWLIETELDGPLDDGHMWKYLANSERYHTGLQTSRSYYATTLSGPEMRAPVKTLKGRVAAIATARKSSREYAASMVAWRPIIEHFVSVHGMDREQFSSLLEDIDAAVIWNSAHQKNLDDIYDHLTATINQWEKPGAAALKADLAAAAGSIYIRQSEKRLAALANRLRSLVAGRETEPSTPPVPGKLTWDDLSRLMEQDRKDNTSHWKKIQ